VAVDDSVAASVTGGSADAESSDKILSSVPSVVDDACVVIVKLVCVRSWFRFTFIFGVVVSAFFSVPEFVRAFAIIYFATSEKCADGEVTHRL
jgi:ABC-type phosphate transport system permease subunit